MNPNVHLRQVSSSGVEDTATFAISDEDSAHIMTILRDTLYSDKVLAVLREYSANAWDAHRSVGKKDVPIRIQIPTSMNPVLVIEDFGPGLSHEDVFKTYIKYGKSTKRATNEEVGFLGIGSKSAFAYSDSFTITSKHGGKKRSYVAVIDSSEKGEVKLLDEQDCPPEETGISIQIAVKPTDIFEFTNKARELFKYFTPKPDINIDIPELPNIELNLQNGLIYESDEEIKSWVAVMGCIPYNINLNQLSKSGNNGVGIADFIRNISGALFFNIGELQISASREDLKYSAHTRQILIKKFEDLVDEYVKRTLDGIKNGNLTPWEQRVRSQIFATLKIPIPKNALDVAEGYVALPNTVHHCEFISIGKNKRGGISLYPASGLTVHRDTTLIIKDDNRSLSGYKNSLNYTGRYYLVRGKPKGILSKDGQDELESIITKKKLTGIPLINISTLPWNPPVYRPTSDNLKHKVRTFVLRTNRHYGYPYSSCWDVIDREPTKDDVFVVLEEFRVRGYSFYENYAKDHELLQTFNIPMPVIYGYKSTEKKPIKKDDCIGTEYETWQKSIPDLILGISPKIRKLYNHWIWGQELITRGLYYSDRYEQNMRLVVQTLGKKHPISWILRRQWAGYITLSKSTNRLDNALRAIYQKKLHLVGGKDNYDTEAKLAMKSISFRYPLIYLPSTGISELWGNHSEAWCDYVKLIDSIDKGGAL